MRPISGQGLALRGKKESSSNFINQLETMMEGTCKKFHLCQSKIKCFSPTMQNEIIEMFYSQIMRKIMNDYGKFGTMADEGSDASNTEL